MRKTILAVGLLMAGTLSLVPPSGLRAEEETTRADGAHFRVILHFEGNGLEKSVLDQVEALWGTAAKLYGLPKGPRAKRLEVHLYRDPTAYTVAEEKITKGAFKKNLAFAHYDTGTAHVALQPFVSDETLARVGLPLLTRSLLLHEAAHLIRFVAMPNFRDHPDWFEDGIAMWLKHRVLVDKGVSIGFEREPVSSTHVARLQALLTTEGFPKVAAILADDIESIGFYKRYGLRYLFFRFLMETYPKEMASFIRKVKHLGGGSRLGRKARDLLASRLGSKRFAGLDGRFRKFVSALDPEWEEVLRSLAGGKKERVQIAFPSSNAVAWVQKPIGKKAYELSGKVEILPNSQHQMNVLVDRSESGFLCVALSGGYGVTLFEFTAKTDNWRRCASARNAGLVVGTPFTVRVVVEGKKLAVSVNGEVVITHEFPGRDMKGAWGLGALAGSAGIWTNFGVK